MANQALIPPPSSLNLSGPKLLIPDTDESLFSSLRNNLRDFFFPEKLPPLKVTSRPVAVRNIWGDYNYTKPASSLSIIVHGCAIAALIAISLMGTKVVKEVKQPDHVELVAPDISQYMPMTPKKLPAMGGGGGGGERSLVQAPKGKLPKVTLQEQITPPVVVVRNDHPKLAVEPTITMQPDVKVANNNLPNLGDPKSTVVGPASNGVGAGGGIGAGAGGGIGSGSGTGFGPGHGGNYGGGVMRVGGGVSAPKAIFAPDPDYSEEARKAKFQGVSVLQLIVDQSGKPRDIRVQRALGMGLDQKAIEAVRNWKFEPAMKDGKPVAVLISVEVNFHLY